MLQNQLAEEPAAQIGKQLGTDQAGGILDDLPG